VRSLWRWVSHQGQVVVEVSEPGEVVVEMGEPG